MGDRRSMSHASLFTAQQARAADAKGALPAQAAQSSATRTLLVRIEGDRTTWDAQGLNGAIWRVNPEQALTIFHYAQAKGDIPLQQQQERLGRAMIRRATVLETFSNIDEAVAVQIDNLPCKEFTEAGDGAHVFLCCAGHCATPREVYNMCGNTELGMAWMQNYPKHTVHNLDTQGVVRLPGKPFCFVEEKHPVLAYMKIIIPPEQFELLVDMDMGGIQGQGWMRVGNDDFNLYANDIREHVLRDAPSTFDLSALTVRIRRPNGAKWFHVSENQAYELVDNADDEKMEQNLDHIIRYVEKPLHLTLRLEIEYALPELVELAE